MEGERACDAESHWNACPRCRELVADLEGIQDVAGRMVEDEEPPARVWVALRAQLAAEGLIREADVTLETPGVSVANPLLGWFSRPAVAGAYLALLLAAAVMLGLGGPSGTEPDLEWNPAASAMAVPVAVRTQLNQAGRDTISTLSGQNPAAAASYRDNLAIVDKLISLCEKTLRAEPDNELAREYLVGAYQQKAELLAFITERGGMGE
jgi:hypothetical protein